MLGRLKRLQILFCLGILFFPHNVVADAPSGTSGAFLIGDKNWSHEKEGGGECYGGYVNNIEADQNALKINGVTDFGPFGVILTLTKDALRAGVYGQHIASASAKLERDGKALWVYVDVLNDHNSTCHMSFKVENVLNLKASETSSIKAVGVASPEKSKSKKDAHETVESDLERAKLECGQIGYKSGTEKFADCVMKLIK